VVRASGRAIVGARAIFDVETSFHKLEVITALRRSKWAEYLVERRRGGKVKERTELLVTPRHAVRIRCP